jgi:hypothetical protein
MSKRKEMTKRKDEPQEERKWSRRKDTLSSRSSTTSPSSWKKFDYRFGFSSSKQADKKC